MSTRVEPQTPTVVQRNLQTTYRLDVSQLPDVAFGHRGHMWWGTALFAVIEGSSLFIAIFAYFYIRRNFDAWPPPRIPYPDLLTGTLSTLLLVGTLYPAYRAHVAAREMDLHGDRYWTTVLSVAAAGVVVLRILEFANLNTRWDETAYGSAVWAVIGFHTTILVVDVLDTWVATSLSYIGPYHTKHFSDTEDGAFYWIYTVLIWLPCYFVLYVYPRL